MDLNHNCTSDLYKSQQEIRMRCRELAEDFIAFKLGKNPETCSRTAKTLRKLSQEMEAKHGILLNGLCDRLNITSNTAHDVFLGVADEVFQGGINWGRIAALYTFAGKLAQYFAQHGMEESQEALTDWVADYVCGLSSWIESHGGWEGFNEMFKEPNEQNGKSWWSGIVLTTLGIGAIAMMFFVE